MTVEPITDEALAEIEAGLEGVTPGPWRTRMDYSVHERSRSIIETHQERIVARASTWTGNKDESIAAHIARMDPDTVASMIARIRSDAERIAELEAGLSDCSSWLERLLSEKVIIEPSGDNEIGQSVIRAKFTLSKGYGS